MADTEDRRQDRLSYITDFYRDVSPDHHGRQRSEILAWSDERLEGVHDYIQWLFPLPEPSPVNPLAPTIDRPTFEAFAEDADLRARLIESFERMLRFYGFVLEPGPTISRAANFEARALSWLTPGNHNHLRITRILRCLATLGLGELSRAWLAALERVYRESGQRISSTSFSFWKSAANERE